MNLFVYRLSYRLGLTHWDSDQVPPEVEQLCQDPTLPAGPMLDLGCGTGTCVIYAARHGREAYGIDFVPRAIQTARQKAVAANLADRSHFIVADVTHLEEAHLPRIALSLDMGCLHGLPPLSRKKYAQGLVNLMLPGSCFLLYILRPKKELGMSYGMDIGEVQNDFQPWFELEQKKPGNFWGNQSTWIWLRRKTD